MKSHIDYVIFALVAAAFFIVACDGSSGGGTKTDTTTGSDTSADTTTTPDTSADTTTTPDTTPDTTTPDTTTPDTTTPDTSEETTTTADTVEEETTLPPDGACDNEADLALLEGGEIDPEAEAQACAMNCIGEPPGCATTCIVDETGLSEACAGCFGAMINCAMENCIGQCMENPESEECMQCVEDSCMADFADCSGVSPDNPPGEFDCVEGVLDGGFDGGYLDISDEGGMLVYAWGDSETEATQQLTVEIYEMYDGPTQPGTYPITAAEADYALCGLCLVLWTEEGIFMPVEGSGSITIDQMSLAEIGQPFVGSFDVVLQEVEIDAEDYTTTVVDDGCSGQLGHEWNVTTEDFPE